ncbi:MAG: DUF2155 domain-containing protein [Pseudomonadota bacterium]
MTTAPIKKNMVVSSALAGLVALTPLSAFGQLEDILGPQEPEESSSLGGDPLDELDALSQSESDPFPELRDPAAQKPVSVTLRALNKVNARYQDIEVDIEDVASFGTLEITARYCDKRPPEEFPETTAFLHIFDTRNVSEEADADAVSDVDLTVDADASAGDSELATFTQSPETQVGRGQLNAAIGVGAEPFRKTESFSDGALVFSGWMFASSPALNPLEHPVYDVWVIDCKTTSTDGGVAENETSALE